ncbi:hypothetical protein SAY87_019703 [Trapa incisa]|uniref:Uncharacterized protein n=1 Tax=Trapa incisa TaxID=236973 RepID=A0AAN7Q2G3_9MYRT|nr:hypothetical protein SAY87_019703 [Trapa incisa]
MELITCRKAPDEFRRACTWSPLFLRDDRSTSVGPMGTHAGCVLNNGAGFNIIAGLTAKSYV